MLALRLAWSLTAAAVRIAGSSTCPAPPEVAAELARSPGAIPDWAQAVTIDLVGDESNKRVRLQIYGSHDVLQGERSLPASSDCHALAVAAATVLRGLELDFGEILPPEPSRPAVVPVVVAPPRSRSLNVELGGAAVGTIDTIADATYGALALASFGFGDFPLRPELSLEVEAPRGLSVGASGHGEWWRAWGAPGLQLRILEGSRLVIGIHSEVPLGVVVARGLDFPSNQVGTAFDFGVSAGVRIGFKIPNSKLRIWGDLRGTFWPVAHFLLVNGIPSQPTIIAQGELGLGIGVSWTQR